jgi:hypothetical protein
MSSSVPLKAKQTLNATRSAIALMMSRERSSSRCSTRLNRSSWPTGLRRAVEAMPVGYEELCVSFAGVPAGGSVLAVAAAI